MFCLIQQQIFSIVFLRFPWRLLSLGEGMVAGIQLDSDFAGELS
jgi:hypothetical protein